MAAVKVLAPAGESVNEEVGGVTFRKGVATVDRSDTQALAYFRRHGYIIEGELMEGETIRPIDARDAATAVKVGTPLRDAAVDPDPNDFLPPTNAGLADPHGPAVVAPELHGSQGTRPVRGGEVPQEPAAQEVAEETHLEVVSAVSQEATGDGAEVAGNESDFVPSATMPPKSGAGSGVAAWRAYAVSMGMSQADADKASKPELVAKYGEA